MANKNPESVAAIVAAQQKQDKKNNLRKGNPPVKTKIDTNELKERVSDIKESAKFSTETSASVADSRAMLERSKLTLCKIDKMPIVLIAKEAEALPAEPSKEKTLILGRKKWLFDFIEIVNPNTILEISKVHALVIDRSIVDIALSAGDAIIDFQSTMDSLYFAVYTRSSLVDDFNLFYIENQFEIPLSEFLSKDVEYRFSLNPTLMERLSEAGLIDEYSKEKTSFPGAMKKESLIFIVPFYSLPGYRGTL